MFTRKAQPNNTIQHSPDKYEGQTEALDGYGEHTETNEVRPFSSGSNKPPGSRRGSQSNNGTRPSSGARRRSQTGQGGVSARPQSNQRVASPGPPVQPREAWT
eukprot:2472027-Rhodomonas_salina.1